MWKRRPEILLCPNIPQPLHGLAPRVILGRAWWDDERQEAFRKTNYRCAACGVHKDRAKRHQWMEGHELYFTEYERGRATYIETVGLCHYCHNFIHDGRMRALMGKGELAQGTYMAIINHGTKVLREAGLVKPTWHERDAELRAMQQAGRLPAWGDWRLVVFGKEYAPLYENAEAQERSYERDDQSGHGDDGAGFTARRTALLRDSLQRKRNQLLLGVRREYEEPSADLPVRRPRRNSKRD